MKWNEWGFRPPLCTYRLNWTMRNSWGWWDEWDDTALQTQDSKFEPWRSEAEFANSPSRRLPTILNLYEWAGKKHFVSFEFECQPWASNSRSPTFQADSFNHSTRTPALEIRLEVREVPHPDSLMSNGIIVMIHGLTGWFRVLDPPHHSVIHNDAARATWWHAVTSVYTDTRWRHVLRDSELKNTCCVMRCVVSVRDLGEGAVWHDPPPLCQKNLREILSYMS